MTEYRDLRVVVIGAGFGAGAHLRALRQLGCQVAAVVTGHPERRAAALAMFPDAEVDWPATEALRRGADLAIIASPSDTHLEVAREAVARRIDLVVEKPIDARLDRAEELVELARQGGVGLAVCLQHRYKPAGRALRSLVGSRGLGTFTGGSVTVPWWRPREYYDEPGRGTYARDGGGVLITQAIHTLDLFVSVVGAPLRVRAQGGRVVQPMEAEDTITGVLDYGAGRLVSVHATVAAFPGRDEELCIAGTAGTALLRGADLMRYPAPGAEPEVLVADPAASTAVDPSAMPTAWHRALLEDAVESFAAKRPPLADGPSALVTQRVVAAMYEAARTERWVDVHARPGTAGRLAGRRAARLRERLGGTPVPGQEPGRPAGPAAHLGQGAGDLDPRVGQRLGELFGGGDRMGVIGLPGQDQRGLG
jgi:predicted dehydrogenase